MRSKPTPRFEVRWQEQSGWYWRLVAANGEIVCRSSKDYTSSFNARRGAERVWDMLLTSDLSLDVGAKEGAKGGTG